MARRLLSLWFVLVRAAPTFTFTAGSALAAGCVIPVPLELEDTDAGPTSPPVILSASPVEFAFPGPITLDPGDQRRLGLSIRDQDRDDTHYIRFYVDYTPDTPVPERTDCRVPPTLPPAEIRVADCSLANVCTDALADGQIHLLEAVIADREFLPDNDPRTAGQPPFRALPEDAAFSSRIWQLRCNPGPTQ